MKKPALKPEMKLGGNPRQYALLGGLVVVLVVVWLMNRDDSGGSGSGPAPATSRPASPVPTPVAGPRTVTRQAPRLNRSAIGGRGGLNTQDFHPTLKPKDPIDTSKVDPTLRLDLLARVRNARAEGGSRSLFDFGSQPPPTEIAKVKPIIPTQPGFGFVGPSKPQPPAPPAPPPPPPPIPLKFYGYTQTAKRGIGPRRAFFLEGEDIYVAGEGDLVKNRYKIIRIGVNSAEVEDTQSKSRQTLPLVEEMANT